MMHLAFLAGIGWRDVVLLLAAMIGVYLVLSVMRLFEMAAKRRDSAQPETGPGFSAWEPYSTRQRQAPQPGPAAPAPELARMLARSGVEVELQRLRSENTRLHEGLARLAEEVSRLKAARDQSPLHGETVALALQGMPGGAMGGQRNYRPLRHLQRRGATAGCVGTPAYGFEWHGQDEDRNGRNTDSGTRPHG